MSIQKKTKKEFGQKVVYYYPVISTYAINKSKTPIWGDGFLTQKEAELEESRLKLALYETNLLANRANKDTLFIDVRKAWMETRTIKFASTQERDLVYCDTYLSVFDDILISKISAEDIQNWITLLSKKYAPKTVRMALGLMSQIMDYAITPLKILKTNPCSENIQKPVLRKKGVESNKYWTKKELRHFITHPLTVQDSYYRMLLLHFSMGMRPGEICGLSVYDFNEENELLTINYGLDKKKRLTDLKNSGAQRSLKLPKSLLSFVKEQRQYSNTLRNKNEKYPYLFVLEDGSSINPDTYCQHFQRLIKKINDSSLDFLLKPITTYGLRHTFATLSLLDGQPLKAVAEVMGISVETMLANYAHIIEQMSGASIESMAETLLGNNKN